MPNIFDLLELFAKNLQKKNQTFFTQEIAINQ